MKSTFARDIDRRLADMVRSERNLVGPIRRRAGRLCEAGALSRARIYVPLLLLRSPARAFEILGIQAIGSGASHRAVPCHHGSARRMPAFGARPSGAA